MKRVVISGINGFIGSSIAKKFLDNGYKVHGLVRKSSDLSLLKNLDIDLSYGDITEKDLPNDLFKKDDIAIHVAGLASDWGPYEKFYRINVEGTKNFALLAEKAQVRRFVHISTVALLAES